jgi:predicted helicase
MQIFLTNVPVGPIVFERPASVRIQFNKTGMFISGSLESKSLTTSTSAQFENRKFAHTFIYRADRCVLIEQNTKRAKQGSSVGHLLPRIPFPPDFHAFAAAGKRLMELHIDYEKQPEYKLEQL